MHARRCKPSARRLLGGETVREHGTDRGMQSLGWRCVLDVRERRIGRVWEGRRAAQASARASAQREGVYMCGRRAAKASARAPMQRDAGYASPARSGAVACREPPRGRSCWRCVFGVLGSACHPSAIPAGGWLAAPCTATMPPGISRVAPTCKPESCIEISIGTHRRMLVP